MKLFLIAALLAPLALAQDPNGTRAQAQSSSTQTRPSSSQTSSQSGSQTAAQAPAQPPGSISGMVMNDAAGAPLRRTTVRLLPNLSMNATTQFNGMPFAQGTANFSPAQQSATSDSDGKFVFNNVAPGNYRVLADRPGYIFTIGATSSRFARSRGLELTVSAGQHMENLALHMAPGAVVHGRVLDDDGEPVTGANVQAMQETYVRGQRTLRAAANSQTDDRGEYRVYGLAPGHYYILANDRADHRRLGPRGAADPPDATAAVPTFYPGAADRDHASRLELHAGDEVAADFGLVRARSVTIRGTVTLASGRPASRGNVSLAYSDSGSFSNADNAQIRDGRFELHATPGRYMLNAVAFPENAGGVVRGEMDPAAMTRQRVDVGSAGVDGLNIVVGSGAHVTGKIRVDDSSFDPQRVSVGLRSLSDDEDAAFFGGMNVTQVKKDGTFEIRNIAPGDYIPVVNVRGGGSNAAGSSATSGQQWYARQVLAGSRDILDTGIRVGTDMTGMQFEVVLASDAATLNGTVLDSNQQPARSALVVLMPSAEHRRRQELFRSTTSNINGQFSFSNVPPGNYSVLAFDDIEDGAWLDPEFQQQFGDRGEKISVRGTEAQQVSTRLMTVNGSSPGQ